MATDKEIIERHGGPAKLAELLGYDKKRGGVQRVNNWLTRGVPAQVKLDHPEIFLVPEPPDRRLSAPPHVMPERRARKVA